MCYPVSEPKIEAIPPDNDSIAHKILQSDGTTPALGALLIAEVAGGSHPITGWVGKDIALPFAYVNLNNIYSPTTHKNLELVGGENLSLVSLGGFFGFRRFEVTVPPETGQIQR